MGRLVQLRRRHPDDTDVHFPDKDNALLSVDYDYDAVGNIRHTQLSANMTGYQRVEEDDYFLYDVNNRMLVNKGSLQDGTIAATQQQGTALHYDEAGNIKSAMTYEQGAWQNYSYVYNKNNQLELIKKNDKSLQAKLYDAAGRVREEHLFNHLGSVSQVNVTTYEHGIVVGQTVRDRLDNILSQTVNQYDQVGNITDSTLRINDPRGNFTIKHHYLYSLWDDYQQSNDNVELTPIIKPPHMAIASVFMTLTVNYSP